MRTRTAQIILLATALVLGVTAPAFNGQSILALLLIGAVVYIENRSRFLRPTP
ncbi:hypothetical protein [Arthrobacter sp. H14]|uniref:hypothetical protein n=1 Tax=Arthrobacter sp. H14 TaxID=1312959 RepID=UPI0012DF0112|nr:hypothetical protein [Arthrobacter sp. H14]